MGYNVLIPRLPRHGLADRKVENLSPLKAEELRDCADASVDIGCGGLCRRTFSRWNAVSLDRTEPDCAEKSADRNRVSCPWMPAERALV
jgi:hypothetical protein